MLSKEIKFLLIHSSIYGLGTIISRLVSFLLLPLYTRYLTPADYGVLETIDVSTFLIGIVITVDIARAMSRFYYDSEDEKRRNKVISSTYLNYTLMAVLFMPVLYLVSDPLAKLLFARDDYGFLLKVSFASMLVGGYTDVGMMYLRLLKKPFIFISITTARLILLILFNVLFIVKYQMGILGILYGSLIVRVFFSILITGAILWRTGLRPSYRISLDLFTYGLPIIPANLANTAVKQSDKYFVLYLMSVADMGIYSVALKFGNTLHQMLTIPFNMVYVPRRFEILKRPDAKQTYARIFTYTTFLLTFIGLGLSMLIPEILRFMVTPEFRKAGDIIPLVVLSMIIFNSTYHFDFGILQSRKTKYLAYINLSTAAVNVGTNYFLIREFGLTGAVCSSIIALSLQSFLLYTFSRRLYPIPYEFRRIAAFVLVALAVYLASRLTVSWKIWFTVPVKCALLALYPAVLIRLGVITREETGKLKQIYAIRIKPLLLKPFGVSSG
jgi:O-antigen/teichoic acid export membrane protein